MKDLSFRHCGTLDWEPPPARPLLCVDDLHLWKIDCRAPLNNAWAVLSERERERAARLRLPRHRERYILAHAGLRQILSKYVSLSAHALVFEYGESGKPFLRGDQGGLEFNLTTSDDLALVAVSRGNPVGIDCERIRPRGELVPIARRMFPPSEAERVEKSGREDQLSTFYLAWTALEAGVKADGRGLFGRKDPPATGSLDVRHCVPAQGFVAAVARASLPPSSQWRTFVLCG